MHLRIYLWLSCVLLAGYVRATENKSKISLSEELDKNLMPPVDTTYDFLEWYESLYESTVKADDGPYEAYQKQLGDRRNECVALTDQETVADAAATEGTSLEVQSDQHAIPVKDAYADDTDDDGSGLEPDESSGSGWGAGPGPDDEDGRGSGDASHELPEDDEDFVPRTTSTTQSAIEADYDSPKSEDGEETVQVVQTPEPITEAPILRSRTFDVVVPNVKSKSSEDTEERPGAGAEHPSRPDQTDLSISGEDQSPVSPDQDPAGSNVNTESRPPDNVVFIMNAKAEDRATSFFAQPGILAAVIGGAVVGLLCAILVVMFIVYRMRKKDEGSYALDEPKRSPAAASYGKGHNNREFYA